MCFVPSSSIALLQDDLKRNSEAQKTLAASGEQLLSALNFFVNSLNTLCNKTIDDTLLTIKTFETARYAFRVVCLRAYI